MSVITVLKLKSIFVFNCNSIRVFCFVRLLFLFPFVTAWYIFKAINYFSCHLRRNATRFIFNLVKMPNSPSVNAVMQNFNHDMEIEIPSSSVKRKNNENNRNPDSGEGKCIGLIEHFDKFGNKKLRTLDNFGGLHSGVENLADEVWGVHNTTMPMELRQKFLRELPDWAEAFHKIIAYDNSYQCFLK